jgi:hypothetical protein
VINMPSFVLSMLGKELRCEELAARSLNDLAAEIAGDILALEQALRREPA